MKSYLLTNFNLCATDYYFTRYGSINLLVYKDSITDTWVTTSRNAGSIVSGYIYNPSTLECTLSPLMSSLGMAQSSYQFLMGLTGIFVGFSFLLGLILVFGGKK